MNSIGLNTYAYEGALNDILRKLKELIGLSYQPDDPYQEKVQAFFQNVYNDYLESKRTELPPKQEKIRNSTDLPIKGKNQFRKKANDALELITGSRLQAELLYNKFWGHGRPKFSHDYTKIMNKLISILSEKSKLLPSIPNLARKLNVSRRLFSDTVKSYLEEVHGIEKASEIFEEIFPKPTISYRNGDIFNFSKETRLEISFQIVKILAKVNKHIDSKPIVENIVMDLSEKESWTSSLPNDTLGEINNALNSKKANAIRRYFSDLVLIIREILKKSKHEISVEILSREIIRKGQIKVLNNLSTLINHLTELIDFLIKRFPDLNLSRQKTENIYETICRQYFEEFFNSKFPSTKLNSLNLRKPFTAQFNQKRINEFMGKGHYDGYGLVKYKGKVYKVAFEYNGPQHYEWEFIRDVFIPNNDEKRAKDKYKKIRERDLIKEMISEDNNIILIKFPYFICPRMDDPQKIKDFIWKEFIDQVNQN